MMRRCTSFVVIGTVIAAGCSTLPPKREPIRLGELGITVEKPSREIGYTNKQAGFYYTESNAEHRTAWQGWHVMARKILDDYRITVDTSSIRKADAEKTDVWPHQFMRTYPSGTTETFTMLDSLDALVVQLDRLGGNLLSFAPFFDWSAIPDDYVVKTDSGMILVASKRHLRRSAADDYPVWIGIGADKEARGILQPVADGRRFSPAELVLAEPGNRVTIVLAAADDEAGARTLVRTVLASPHALIEKRKQRMEKVLNAAFVRTDNARFDKALHWAMLSMDALLMNQLKKGIFAGLPWFDNYWGRDSFISLPGATLVTGRFDEAKEILQSFAEWQETNPRSTDYGRIPNLVTTTSISYNTADGTPWFVLSLYDYLSMSGDTAFGRAMYPIVRRSIEGTLKYHTDKNRLLVHGDAETWMDAVGPDGPWSPRGNRANDIQALWIRQLIAASALARSAGDDTSAQLWENIIDTALMRFQQIFIDPTTHLIYDHLRADGTPDTSLRPNQLFTMDVVQNPFVKRTTFVTVTEKLVYPYGVGSLSPDDPNFHPYHHHEPYYVQDAAYHQGIVWTWLAGRWIQTATGYGLQDLAYKVTDNMVHQILDRGAVGTLSELLDAVPRPGETEPRLSGTFSQAWSLAEFIRNAYQSYFGVTISAAHRQLWLFPRLPEAIRSAQFVVPGGLERIELGYQVSGAHATVTLDGDRLQAPYSVILGWPLPNHGGRMCSFMLAPHQKLELGLAHDGYSQRALRGDTSAVRSFLQTLQPEPELQNLQLAVPYLRPGLKALKGPDHRLLSSEEIKTTNPSADVLLDANDPTGDDVGTGRYVYPLTQNLRPGSLDLTRVRISADDCNVYFHLGFRALSNPGWHPEYGFQLTFAAISITKDAVPGPTRRSVGRNANYTLPASFGYHDIIYVGGGVRVEDGSGAVLAEYLPIAGDERTPLGNPAQRSVDFALPVNVIGTPDPRWRFAVLVGAQDDHGGAGLGDFRAVAEKALEWTGGGRKSPTDPNVYDTFFSHSHSSD